MTVMTLARDSGGQNTFSPPFAELHLDTTLADGVEQTVTIPESNNPIFPNYNVVFSYHSTDGAPAVYVARNQTATIPGGSFAFTNSELNPSSRTVSPGDVLHFITTNVAAVVNMSLYDSK